MSGWGVELRRAGPIRVPTDRVGDGAARTDTAFAPEREESGRPIASSAAGRTAGGRLRSLLSRLAEAAGAWSRAAGRPSKASWGLLAVVALALPGCSSIRGDACAVGHTEGVERVDDGACNGGFLSALNQRTTLFGGDDNPKLYTGEAARRGPIIDTSVVNARRSDKYRPIVGYMGSVRVELAAAQSDAGIQNDLLDLRKAGSNLQNPDDRVTVSFENATLDFFLKQMLGGALGVNYVAPQGLGGSVTFRTEQPVPKAQVLQIVRDILARDGLVMRLSNGVFQIGRGDQMAAFEAATAASRIGDTTTRVVRLRRGSAPEYVQFIRPLLPDYVQIEATSSPDSLLLRGPSQDLQKLEELIGTLGANGLGDDRVAIIQLRQSAPEVVAAKLIEFYRTRTTSQVDQITIVPLENQQSLLVGTRDARMMEGVRRLIAELDRDLSDEVSLRIIPLEYLSADQVAQQLIAILAGSGQGGNRQGSKVQDGSNRGGGGGQGQGQGSAAAAMAPRVQQSSPEFDEDGNNVTAPGFAMGGGGGGGRRGNGFDQPDSNGGNGGGGNGAGRPASGQGSVVVGGTEAIRIAADTRNNTLLINSNYTMFKRVKEVVRALDVPQAQVVIEATVLEVTINDQLQYGVQWFLQAAGINIRASADPTARDPGGSGGVATATATIGQSDIGVVMTALQGVTNVKVLSSPYLTVVDGSSARLQIGDQIPFATRTQQSNNVGNVTVTQQIEVKDTGIILEVTPKVRSNNGVLLAINQSVSKPQDTTLNGNVTPVISNRQMKSDILVQSGHTALLGGLIQERHDKTESGVPVLKNVPYLGELFKQTSDTVGRVEMLVMITPRVVRRTSEIDNITRMLHKTLYPKNMPR